MKILTHKRGQRKKLEVNHKSATFVKEMQKASHRSNRVPHEHMVLDPAGTSSLHDDYNAASFSAL